MSDRCSNCGSADADTYELLVRGDQPTQAHLCDPCHEALKEEVDIA